jgi:hypothetical protein
MVVKLGLGVTAGTRVPLDRRSELRALGTLLKLATDRALGVVGTKRIADAATTEARGVSGVTVGWTEGAILNAAELRAVTVASVTSRACARRICPTVLA